MSSDEQDDRDELADWAAWDALGRPSEDVAGDEGVDVLDSEHLEQDERVLASERAIAELQWQIRAHPLGSPSGDGGEASGGGAKADDAANIWGCGEAVVASLHDCLALCAPSAHLRQDLNVPKALRGFRALLALANDKINSVPFSEVQPCWLKLYTYASIGMAICTMAEPAVGMAVTPWLKALRYLDVAIIVAGAQGLRDQKVVQDLVRSHQIAGSHAEPSELSQERPSKRQRLEPPLLLVARQGIPEPASPPSLSSFTQSAHRHPFILRGHVSDWPACRRWASAKHLLGRVGYGRVVPVEVGRSYTDDGWGQEIIPFEHFLQRVGYADLPNGVEPPEEDPPDRPVYLAQHSLFTQFPDLVGDMTTPDYVYAEPPAPEYMPEYVKPGNADGLVTNVWIGAGEGKVISPAHTDPYYNCYAQVLGRKRVWIAPPSATPHMYAFDPAATDAEDDETGPMTSYTTNTSRVPIFDGPTEASRRKHPAFHAEVVPHSFEAVLEPGDLLFMPPKWWHAMRSEGEGVSWSVSMWF